MSQPARQRILVVDDETSARSALVTILKEEGYDVAQAGDGEEALGVMETFNPQVVLTDVRMPKMDGLTLMQKAHSAGTPALFVMMTAFGRIESAVEAMTAGAENYLVKPLDVKAVLAVLKRTFEKVALKEETTLLKGRIQERFKFTNIIGEGAELQAVFDVVKRVAPTKATVLILGESGTGKELIAQAIHQESPRADRPFIRVNCAALSETLLESELFGHEKGSFTGAAARREGRFELADGGSLFLDEIGDISPAIQVKLLRVLQQREFERVGGTQTIKVDVRLVAATNRDLGQLIKLGQFREDLYYRLNVVSVTLPPLRNRKTDIPALVTHFVKRFSEAYGKEVKGLAPGLMNALLAHDWPGNVRELENVIERAVVLLKGDYLTADDLPASLSGPRAETRGAEFVPGQTMASIERSAILKTLELVNGSTHRAAEMLGISVRTIQYRLKEYGDAKGEAPRGGPVPDTAE